MGKMIKPGFGPKAWTQAVALGVLGVGVLAVAQPASALASAPLGSVGLRDVARALPPSKSIAVLSPSRAASRGLVARPRVYVPPLAGPGPLGAFLYDRTLRHGDIVATPTGLLVFEGKRRAAEHQDTDFAPVATSRAVGLERRVEVLALDRTIRQTPSNVVMLAEALEPRSLVILKSSSLDDGASFVSLGAPTIAPQ